MQLHLTDLGLTLLALVPAGVIGCVAGNALRRAASRDRQSTVSRPTTTDRF